VLPPLELVFAAIPLKERGGLVMLPIETAPEVGSPASKAMGQEGGDNADDVILRVLELGGLGLFVGSRNVVKAVMVFGSHSSFGCECGGIRKKMAGKWKQSCR
jgi:hypothetical protein